MKYRSRDFDELRQNKLMSIVRVSMAKQERNYFKTVTLAHFNDRKKILSLFALKEINVFDFIFQIQESK